MENQNNTSEILSVGNLVIKIISEKIAGSNYMLPADVDFKKLYSFCEKHRITPLIAQSVLDCSYAAPEEKSVFKKALFKSSIRYETQCKEKAELTEIFCKEGIKHCFLKGQKISQYYKNPEERFMLDMDIYIESQKLTEAENILKERGYELNTFSGDKDVGYSKKPFLNIELHQELKYDYDKGYEYYKGAFSRLVAEENMYTLNMTNEDFYVYILSHSAHHFEESGTGIRNILDHYYLKTQLKPVCNEGILKNNLEAIGLTRFCETMDKLAEFWFNGGACDDNIRQVSDFIMLSGVFGNEANYYLKLVSNSNQKSSSYILSRLFPSAKDIAPRYTILKKAPFLLPIIWIVRFLSAVFNKTDMAGEIKGFNTASQNDNGEFSQFMRKNGL